MSSQHSPCESGASGSSQQLISGKSALLIKQMVLKNGEREL